LTAPDALRAILLAAHLDWWTRHVQPGFRGTETAHSGAFDSSAAGYQAGYSHGFELAASGRTDVEVLAGLAAAHDAWWRDQVRPRRGQRIPAHVEAFAKTFSRAGYEAGAAFGWTAQRRSQDSPEPLPATSEK